jgi:hypothetical protein
VSRYLNERVFEATSETQLTFPTLVLLDEFTGPLETLNGASILGRVEFRKILADDAFIGQKDNHTYGTKYPTDVICDNGVIHAIKHVLTPGYKPPANPWTGNDTASTPWASGRQA